MVEYKNILFCTDFSEDADVAFLHALSLAKKHEAKLHILHVPHSPFAYSRHIVDEHIPPGKGHHGQALFDEEIAKQAELDVMTAYGNRLEEINNYEIAIRCGAPDVEIVRYARQHKIDLIVMGALGKAHGEHLERGSTVASVSKYAHCHVMAIRHSERRLTPSDQLL
jgi:nucleotide-binding universal stress UspA family protein